MSKTFPAAFAFMLNTLLGNALLLLPGRLSAVCGTGAWLIPLIILPAVLGITVLFWFLPQNPFTDGLFGVLSAAATGLAICLAVRVTCRLFLPETYALPLTAVLALLIWAVLKSGDGIYRLNLIFLVCFGLITVLFAVSAADGSTGRLMPVTLSSPLRGAAICAVAVSGLVSVPALKREQCALAPLLAACVAGALVMSGVCAAVTACIGSADNDALAAVTVLRSGGGLLYARLLAAAMLYSLLSVKPALNCAHAACVTLGERARVPVAAAGAVLSVIFGLL